MATPDRDEEEEGEGHKEEMAGPGAREDMVVTSTGGGTSVPLLLPPPGGPAVLRRLRLRPRPLSTTSANENHRSTPDFLSFQPISTRPQGVNPLAKPIRAGGMSLLNVPSLEPAPSPAPPAVSLGNITMETQPWVTGEEEGPEATTNQEEMRSRSVSVGSSHPEGVAL